MDMNVFLRIYAARFSALKPSDGIDEWQDFISGVKSEDVMRMALDEIANRNAYIRAKNPLAVIQRPLLGDVRVAFWRKIESMRAVAAPVAECSCEVCKGSGNVIVAVGDSFRVLVPGECEVSDFRGTAVFPCPACRANRYNDAAQKSAVEKSHITDDCAPSVLVEKFTKIGKN